MKLLTNSLLIFQLIICNNIICQETKIEATRSLFSQELFKRQLNFLGSDLFEGRAPGTVGGYLAAKYLAIEFDKLKLKPIGSEATYYQNIPLHSSKPLITSQLKIYYEEEEIQSRLYEDFVLYQSGEPIYIPASTELVFVGYGIIAPEFDYNDYQNIDVEGKIVVFLDGEPNSTDETYFAGKNNTIYSTHEAKRRIALSRGAKGTILIPNIKFDRYFNWQELVRVYSFPNISLISSPSSSFDIIMNPESADVLFIDSGYSLDDIFEMHKKFTMRNFQLKVRLSFQGSFKQDDFISPNIIGLLEGNDPLLKDSYVIVSAHYDHLGIGPAVKCDSIYNGVFDNAEGVAAILEIARIITQYNIYHKRSIIFLLTTGEESGLLGSRYYVQNPIVPLYKTIADINVDGLASFDTFKSIIGVGKEFSSLSEILKDIALERNLTIDSIPDFFSDHNTFHKSDQYSFAKAGVPSILLLEGTHYENLSKEEGISKLIEYSKNIYHTPFDDLNQQINYLAVAQHIEIIIAMIERICNSTNEPKWLSGTPFINTRLISKAQKK